MKMAINNKRQEKICTELKNAKQKITAALIELERKTNCNVNSISIIKIETTNIDSVELEFKKKIEIEIYVPGAFFV